MQLLKLFLANILQVHSKNYPYILLHTNYLFLLVIIQKLIPKSIFVISMKQHPFSRWKLFIQIDKNNKMNSNKYDLIFSINNGGKYILVPLIKIENLYKIWS